MLIGQSGPIRELDLESFIVFIIYLTHDFKSNRKAMLMETNQPLLSWKVSQPPLYAQKSQPAPVLNFNSMSCWSWKSILIVEANLKIR